MDPQVSTSFIPKEALTAQKARSGGMGIFFLISLLIFIVSLIAAGGAFAYQQVLNQKLADAKTSLAKDQGAFDPATIAELVRMDSRINQAKQLLQKHVAPSGIFDFLALNTLVNVQFTSLDYKLNDDGSADVELNGSADSFATIALQSDALGKLAALKDVIFSNITVDQGGRVNFALNATVDKSIISYAKLLNAPAPVQ